MKTLELLRRAAGKPPGYLARRVFTEARRIGRSRRIKKKIRCLTPQRLARELGSSSISAWWEVFARAGLLYNKADRDHLRSLYRDRFSGESRLLREKVDRILAHEFDLLGSGPTRLGPEIDWQEDFKSGRCWPLLPSERIDYAELDQPSDVKVAWELSRCQHLVTLGQAWTLWREEAAVREFESQVQSWIRANPVGFGVNWACTMEVALRAVNWIWALSLFGDAPLAGDFREEMLLALYRHGLWIPEHLEFSAVNGNHYISDALGMVACGLLFKEAREGARWLEQGREILEREILLQVEEDGPDIEASVAYHRLVLEIFLTGARLLQAAGLSPSPAYRDRLGAMIDFVHGYTLPSGLSPVIGDADDGRVLIFDGTPLADHRYLLSTGCSLFARPAWKHRAGRYWAESLWFLGPSSLAEFDGTPEQVDERSRAFPASGFFILRSEEQYVFIDAAPVGFRGLGGHGHNDCLSFEWHAGGRPLLTDSGLFVYTASPQWRDRFRSTAFHNTIRVDREEINRFLSPPTLWFLGNDAQPVDVRHEKNRHGEIVRAGHTGYRRLADPVMVYRQFEVAPGGTGLRLIDRLEGRQSHFVEFFFHAAPGCVYHAVSEEAIEFRWPKGVCVRIGKLAGPSVRMEEIEGWFAPSYGVKIARPVCVASVTTRLPFEIVWNLKWGRSPNFH
jgi:hypothetical protein